MSSPPTSGSRRRRTQAALALVGVLVASGPVLAVGPVGAVAGRPAAVAPAAQAPDPDPTVPDPTAPDPTAPESVPIVADGPVTDTLALSGEVTPTTTPGGAIDGAFTLTNIGEDDLVRAAVAINSSTDESLADVGVPAGWTCRDVTGVPGQSVFCDAGLFPAGASATFTFSAVASNQLTAGDLVTTTVTANAEIPVQDDHPVLVLATAIVPGTAPVTPIAVSPRFTG